MKKNDRIELLITDMGVDGSGIGKLDGMTFFVKDALIGDTVNAKIIKLKKTYGYARLMEVKQPSPDRVLPRCPLHRQCGGCQLQALSYEKQLAYKQDKVMGSLVRIGGFCPEDISMEPIIGMGNCPEDISVEPLIGMGSGYRYRNKAQFPVGRDKNGNVVAGFYAARTHNIIPVEDCCLGIVQNGEIMRLVLAWMRQYGIAPYDEKDGSGLVRHVLIRCGFRTQQLMVCLVINGKVLPHSQALVDSMTTLEGMTGISVSSNEQRNNVIMGDTVKTLWGTGYIEDFIGEIKFRISPLSFYQVNPVQTEVLYKKVMEYAGLSGEETVWDLYCGIGTISLFLAQKAKMVYGVEVVPQAVQDARINAEMNHITNAEFLVGKAEEVLPQYYSSCMQAEVCKPQYYSSCVQAEVCKPKVIVVDPPRKGCKESLLDTIVKMQAERVVYVSCDPATLARDLKYLCRRGYVLKKVQAVDVFCQTVHVETVVMLSHKKPDSVINVKVEFGEGEGKVPLDNIAKRAEAYKPKERVTYKMI